MNDRLRFRAWHKPTKRMFNVYGFNSDFVFENSLDGIGTSETLPAKFEDCEIMQCLGEKDGKEKLIFEGDIVKTGMGDLAIVKWGEYKDCGIKENLGKDYDWVYEEAYGDRNHVGYFISHFKDESSDYCLDNELYFWTEIVGNIYENSDLAERQ